MSVRRFLSRRDKSPAQRPAHHPHIHHKDGPHRTERKPDHFDGIFTSPNGPLRRTDKEEEKKVKAILERLRHYGIDNLVESNVEYALRAQSSNGDPEAAFRLLMLLEDTYEGIIRPYDPKIKLVGAVNRQGTTCYLDALLFAMFARLDSFEAMLYENFEDAKRKRLAGLLRLWVNMLRTGQLITIDVTEHIQRALADSGWTDAGLVKQQDPSEAFTFITGQLELPMLTLKMDMYHTGKEDPQDDHKFINERLLEVALLDQPPEGSSVITLEDCLEHYFNNRIEVKRHLEMQRRNTLKSASIADSATKIEKESGTHVEVVEVAPETPIASSPAVLTPSFEQQPTFAPAGVDNLRPTMARKRADSIFSQRKVELTGIDPNELKNVDTNASHDTKNTMRKMSTRTEVLMPAWQFFKLLPWYTDHMPESDVQVAAHFAKKRPVLGICLKRYSYTTTGQARRIDTYVDIPLEISVPNFVSDDGMENEGPLVGNFRLMLQSVVCHRGVSVHSGHYVCLARGSFGTGVNSDSRRGSRTDDEDEAEDPWMRFDDLAAERIVPVDIHEALKKETPYLLFYQVMPIGGGEHDEHSLPSYTEATSRSQSNAFVVEEKPFIPNDSTEPTTATTEHLEQVSSAPTATAQGSTGVLDFGPDPETGSTTGRRSSISDTTILPSEQQRGRLSLITSSTTPSTSTAELKSPSSGTRRKSITFDTSSASGSIRTATDTSVPTTPSEEKGNAFLQVAKTLSGGGSRRGSAKTSSRSRPTSTGPAGENGGGSGRFSLDLKKLTSIVSNKDGKGGETAVVIDNQGPVIVPSDAVAKELAGQRSASDADAALSEAVNASRESVGAVAIARPASVGPDSRAAVSRKPVPVTAAPAEMKPRAKEKERRTGKKGRAGEERDCCVM